MNGNRVLSIGLVALLLISALGVFLPTVVSATPDTHTWDGGGANALASTKENWIGDTSAPEAGDSVLFNAGALACTWDLGITLATFTTSATYSGVITISASTSWGTTGNIAIGAGTLVDVATSTISCAGDFLYTAGTATNIILTMTGTGATLRWNTPANTIKTLTNTGSITLASTDIGPVFSNLYNSGAITIPSGKTFEWDQNTGLVFSNTGTINGPGKFQVFCYYTVTTISFGAVNAPVRLFTYNTAKTLTLSANAILGSSLTIDSDGSGTMTLDTSTSNYALNATSITIGALGILLGRASTITCAGNLDSSAGTFTVATSSLIMTGSSKTLKLASPYALNDLTVGTGASITLASNAVVAGNFVQTGALSISTYTLAVTGTSTFNSDMAFTTAGTYTPTGAIVCAGNWDTSGATYTTGTVAVSMAGSSKTIALKASGAIYDLSIAQDCALESDLIVANELTVASDGLLIGGAYVIHITGSSDTPLLGYGWVIGEIYLDSSAELQTVQVSEYGVALHTQYETHIDIGAVLWLNVTPDAEYVVIEITSVNVGATFGGPVLAWTATATNDVGYEISALEVNISYAVMGGGHGYYRDKVEAGGSISFVVPGSGNAQDMMLARSEFQQMIDWTYAIIPTLAGIFLLIGLMGYMTGQLGSMDSTGKGKRKKR